MDRHGEEQIRVLAMNNAHIHRFYTAYQHGLCSWENMLLHMVAALAQANQELHDELVKRISHSAIQINLS